MSKKVKQMLAGILTVSTAASAVVPVYATSVNPTDVIETTVELISTAADLQSAISSSSASNPAVLSSTLNLDGFNLTIAAGQCLLIAPQGGLTISNSSSLTINNDATLIVEGDFNNNGTVIVYNNSIVSGNINGGTIINNDAFTNIEDNNDDVESQEDDDTTDSSILQQLISIAQQALDSVIISDTADDVLPGQDYVTSAEAASLANAIDDAINNTDIESATYALETAIAIFNASIKTGIEITTPPSTPTNVGAFLNGDVVTVYFTTDETTSSVTVSYTGVDSNGEAVSGTMYDDTLSGSVNVSLRAGTYSFTVVATNDMGDSEQTSAVSVTVPVVVTELETAINDALEAAFGVIALGNEQFVVDASLIAKGVNFVSEEVYAQFNAAIDTATLQMETLKSQAEIDMAVEQINEAAKAFSDAINYGTNADLDATSLVSAIILANTAKAGVIVNDTAAATDDVIKDVKYVTTSELSALNSAITQAITTLTNAQNTEELSQAAVELTVAIDAFEDAIKIGTMVVEQAMSVLSVVNPANIAIAVGTSAAQTAAMLPTSVNANVDGETTTIPVEWAVDGSYNADKAGNVITYTGSFNSDYYKLAAGVSAPVVYVNVVGEGVSTFVMPIDTVADAPTVNEASINIVKATTGSAITLNVTGDDVEGWAKAVQTIKVGSVDLARDDDFNFDGDDDAASDTRSTSTEVTFNLTDEGRTKLADVTDVTNMTIEATDYTVATAESVTVDTITLTAPTLEAKQDTEVTNSGIKISVTAPTEGSNWDDYDDATLKIWSDNIESITIGEDTVAAKEDGGFTVTVEDDGDSATIWITDNAILEKSYSEAEIVITATGYYNASATLESYTALKSGPDFTETLEFAANQNIVINNINSDYSEWLEAINSIQIGNITDGYYTINEDDDYTIDTENNQITINPIYLWATESALVGTIELDIRADNYSPTTVTVNISKIEAPTLTVAENANAQDGFTIDVEGLDSPADYVAWVNGITEIKIVDGDDVIIDLTDDLIENNNVYTMDPNEDGEVDYAQIKIEANTLSKAVENGTLTVKSNYFEEATTPITVTSDADPLADEDELFVGDNGNNITKGELEDSTYKVTYGGKLEFTVVDSEKATGWAATLLPNATYVDNTRTAQQLDVEYDEDTRKLTVDTSDLDSGNFTINLVSDTYESVSFNVDIEVADAPTLTDVTVKANADIVITSDDADWAKAITSITLADGTEIPADYEIDEATGVITLEPLYKWTNEQDLGEIELKIAANGYETAEVTVTVTAIGAPTLDVTFEATDIEKLNTKRNIIINVSGLTSADDVSSWVENLGKLSIGNEEDVYYTVANNDTVTITIPAGTLKEAVDNGTLTITSKYFEDAKAESLDIQHGDISLDAVEGEDNGLLVAPDGAEVGKEEAATTEYQVEEKKENLVLKVADTATAWAKTILHATYEAQARTNSELKATYNENDNEITVETASLEPGYYDITLVSSEYEDVTIELFVQSDSTPVAPTNVSANPNASKATIKFTIDEEDINATENNKAEITGGTVYYRLTDTGKMDIEVEFDADELEYDDEGKLEANQEIIIRGLAEGEYKARVSLTNASGGGAKSEYSNDFEIDYQVPEVSLDNITDNREMSVGDTFNIGEITLLSELDGKGDPTGYITDVYGNPAENSTATGDTEVDSIVYTISPNIAKVTQNDDGDYILEATNAGTATITVAVTVGTQTNITTATLEVKALSPTVTYTDGEGNSTDYDANEEGEFHITLDYEEISTDGDYYNLNDVKLKITAATANKTIDFSELTATITNSDGDTINAISKSEAGTYTITYKFTDPSVEDKTYTIILYLTIGGPSIFYNGVEYYATYDSETGKLTIQDDDDLMLPQIVASGTYVAPTFTAHDADGGIIPVTAAPSYFYSETEIGTYEEVDKVDTTKVGFYKIVYTIEFNEMECDIIFLQEVTYSGPVFEDHDETITLPYGYDNVGLELATGYYQPEMLKAFGPDGTTAGVTVSYVITDAFDNIVGTSDAKDTINTTQVPATKGLYYYVVYTATDEIDATPPTTSKVEIYIQTQTESENDEADRLSSIQFTLDYNGKQIITGGDEVYEDLIIAETIDSYELPEAIAIDTETRNEVPVHRVITDSTGKIVNYIDPTTAGEVYTVLFTATSEDGVELTLTLIIKVLAQLDALEATPAPGNYNDAALINGELTVKLECTTDTEGVPVVIYYTTDGSEPTEDSTEYTSAGIKISESTTIKAIATAPATELSNGESHNGFANSEVFSGTYTINNTPSLQTVQADTLYDDVMIAITGAEDEWFNVIETISITQVDGSSNVLTDDEYEITQVDGDDYLIIPRSQFVVDHTHTVTIATEMYEDGDTKNILKKYADATAEVTVIDRKAPQFVYPTDSESFQRYYDLSKTDDFTLEQLSAQDETDESVDVIMDITFVPQNSTETVEIFNGTYVEYVAETDVLIDTNNLGVYTITYTAEDSSGNAADSETVTVVVNEISSALTSLVFSNLVGGTITLGADDNYTLNITEADLGEGKTTTLTATAHRTCDVTIADLVTSVFAIQNADMFTSGYDINVGDGGATGEATQTYVINDFVAGDIITITVETPDFQNGVTADGQRTYTISLKVVDLDTVAALKELVELASVGILQSVVSVDGSDVSELETWVTDAEYSLLKAAISDAQSLNTTATYDQIESAYAALESAWANYIPKAGTKDPVLELLAINFSDNVVYDSATKTISVASGWESFTVDVVAKNENTVIAGGSETGTGTATFEIEPKHLEEDGTFLITLIYNDTRNGITFTVVESGASVPVYDENLRGVLSMHDISFNGINADLISLAALKELTGNYTGVSAISPLQYANSLQSVVLRNNEIKTIASLSALPNLETIDVRNNEILVLNLTGFPALQTLQVSGNDIKRIVYSSGRTANATNDVITQLDLSNNSLGADFDADDIELLASEGYYETVDGTEYYYLQDVDALSGLVQFTALSDLNVSSNELTSLAGLDKVTTLTKLDASDNPLLTDVDSLSTLVNLEYLDLSDAGTGVSDAVDIGSINSLTNLETLILSGIEESGVKGLGSIANLTSIDTVVVSSSVAKSEEFQDAIVSLVTTLDNNNEAVNFSIEISGIDWSEEGSSQIRNEVTESISAKLAQAELTQTVGGASDNVNIGVTTPDTTPPTVWLEDENGNMYYSEQLQWQQYTTFIHPDVKAGDNADESILPQFTVTLKAQEVDSVDTSVPVNSVYTLVYTAEDSSGNKSTHLEAGTDGREVVVAVEIVENPNIDDDKDEDGDGNGNGDGGGDEVTSAPVLTYNGSTGTSTIYVDYGTFFNLNALKEGIEVSDGSELSSPVFTYNGAAATAVNTNQAGTYTITYSATNEIGTGTITFTVIVTEEGEDAPLIGTEVELNENGELELALGAAFSPLSYIFASAGTRVDYTIYDVNDNNAIINEMNIDTSQSGTYLIAYEATKDGETEELELTVVIGDGGSTDGGDGDGDGDGGSGGGDGGSGGDGDGDGDGDGSGDADTTAPQFNYTGNTYIQVFVGNTYTAPTITATDAVDGDTTVSLVITNSSGDVVNYIDTSSTGRYTLTYTTTDKAGNTNELTITVAVVSNTATDTWYPSYTYPTLGPSSSTLDSDDEDETEEVDEDDDEVEVVVTVPTITPSNPAIYIDITRVFSDVLYSSWYYGDIAKVYTKGLMMGVTDTTFAPDETATRAQLATILHRMDGDHDIVANSRFYDVSNNAWYAPSVTWAVQAGVYSGFEDGSFRPEDAITREQLVAIIANYARYKGYNTDSWYSLTDFVDAADVSPWALSSMEWAVASGIVGGKEGALLDPQGTATRAEIAAIINRFLELN